MISVSSGNFEKIMMSEEKRSRQVLVRLTDSEHKDLRAEARASGRELAQHVRWLAFQAHGLLAEKAERRPRSAALTPLDLETIREVIREELDQGDADKSKRKATPKSRS